MHNCDRLKMLKAIQKSKAIRLTVTVTLATLTGVCLLLGETKVRDAGISKWIGAQPAAAQFARPQDVWRQVYERLPNLAMENQYVSKETGEVAANNTLASRLLQYHIYVKNRLPNYRFDWKLTIADYLGAHDLMEESQYPGSTTLQQNPMESDRAVIEKLSRGERDALVNALVSIYNPNANQTPVATPNPSPPPATTPNRRPAPRFPQPGDAELLLP